jgi:hypothetical protein
MGVAIHLKISEKGFDFGRKSRFSHDQVPSKVDHPLDMLNFNGADFDTGVTGCAGPEFFFCHHLAHHGWVSYRSVLGPSVLLQKQIFSGGKEMDFEIVNDVSGSENLSTDTGWTVRCATPTFCAGIEIE